jgi:hypothetical protein
MRIHANDPTTVNDATLAELYRHLSLQFENRQLVEQSNQELNRLRQGRTPFPEFISEFERLLLLAGGQMWPDDVRIARLRSAINQEMRQAIIGQVLPIEYEAFVEHLHRVANDLDEYNRIHNLRMRSLNRLSHGPSREPLLNTTTQPHWPATVTVPTLPVTMDLSATVPAPATQARPSPICFNCGRTGHISRICPEPQRPRPPRPGTIDHTTTMIPITIPEPRPTAQTTEETDSENE